MRKITGILLAVLLGGMICACKPNPNDGKCDKCGANGITAGVIHFGENDEDELCVKCAIAAGYLHGPNN